MLDPDSGELCESRFEPSRERLSDWAIEWQGPEEIQRLRDRTRLRKALAGERTGWAQRLHALPAHEG